MSATVRPQNTEGEKGAPGIPGYPGQDFGKQAPGISQHKDHIGRGRSERHSSLPPAGLKQVRVYQARAGTPGPGTGPREENKAESWMLSVRMPNLPQATEKMPPFLTGIFPKTVGTASLSSPASVSRRQN